MSFLKCLKMASLLVTGSLIISGCYETRKVGYESFASSETKPETRYIPNRIIHTIELKDGSLYNFYKKQEVSLKEAGEEIILEDKLGKIHVHLKKSEIGQIEYDRLRTGRTVAFLSLAGIIYLISNFILY